MANTIEYAKVFNTNLDKQMIPLPATGWMDANAGLVKYSGGNEIKIPSMAMSGLGNYDRDEGYPIGSVSLSYETMKMTMDRAMGFNFDAMDVDESNFLVTAGNVMGEFQRTEVAPEIDAYRFSKTFALADAVATNKPVRNYTPAAGSILKEIIADVATVQDQIGENEPLVIHMALPVATILDLSDNISKKMDVVEFKHGKIALKVKGINDIPILRTPSDRMKTKFDFFDGDTQYGFKVAADAKDINWIIYHRRAPIAVCKTDVSRVFDPKTWQKANAWHVDYRKYHDLWITKHKLAGVFVNCK